MSPPILNVVLNKRTVNRVKCVDEKLLYNFISLPEPFEVLPDKRGGSSYDDGLAISGNTRKTKSATVVDKINSVKVDIVVGCPPSSSSPPPLHPYD